ncbi:MAG: HU family DNA-binding protein [bacterium]|nr:HU family DNA-binding protein [bacterium]
MNKEDLIKQVSAKTRLSQKDVGEVINAALGVVSESLTEGERVTLVGFGTFQVRERSAREGRNPRTGEVIQIAAKKSAVWIPGKGLRERVEAARAKSARKK